MSEPPSRAGVIGAGLIGGSVGLGLRAAGWHVTVSDAEPGRAAQAVAIGAADAAGDASMADVDVVVVATPVGMVAELASKAIAACPHAWVTDVGSVKASIVSAVDHPRFVGGHPMAGSELEGIEGADASLFSGATWVLTPTATTDPSGFARVRSMVTALGADAVAIAPQRHDDLVALVSHVPHLTAATLMALAAETSEEHATLLRLAAGGFRDMTRIAAGHPGIWPDICAENRPSIVATLDRLIAALSDVRGLVSERDAAGLTSLLSRARAARVNLPQRAATRPEDLAEIRVPVPDRPAVLAEVTTLLGELDVNIHDLEIAHSAEGDRGVLIVVIDARLADLTRGALLARGFRPSMRRLEPEA